VHWSLIPTVIGGGHGVVDRIGNGLGVLDRIGLGLGMAVCRGPRGELWD
jgi:hypothetical protein